MKKTLLILTVLALVAGGCREKKEGGQTVTTETSTTQPTAAAEMWNGYTKIAPDQIDKNFIQRIGEEWMLITAGNAESYNTMTASWGAMGIIWGKPAMFMMVRNTRHTYGFLQNADHYTLTFFDGAQKEAMTYLGSHSGRDGDKVAQTGLTPMETPLKCMSFEQATMIIECRKIFDNKLDPKSIFDDKVAAEYVRTGEYHDLFIGEIVNVWVKK